MPQEKTKIYTLFALFLLIFIDTVGFGLIWPLFAPLLTDVSSSILPATTSLFTRDILYGITLGAFPICAFFGAPILGDLSDHIGRKKVLLVCLLGTAIGVGICALGVTYKDVWLLILGRALLGALAGSQAIAQATIIDISEPHRKAHNLSIITLASNVGWIAGPMIGGLLINNHLVRWFSFTTPFTVSAFLAIINATLLAISFKETVQPQKASKLYSGKTGYQSIAEIDPSSLEFPRGAPAASERTKSTWMWRFSQLQRLLLQARRASNTEVASNILDICEHREQGRNKAENQNATGIDFTKGINVLLSAFKSEQIRAIAIIYLLLQLGWSTYFSFNVLYLAQLYHYNGTKIGYFLAFQSIFFALASLVGIRVALRFCELNSIIKFSFIALGISLATIALNKEIVAWIAAIPATIFVALSYIGMLTTFSNAVNPDAQGWVMGIAGSMNAVAWSLSTILSGALGALNSPFPFIIAAVFIFSANFFAMRELKVRDL